MTTRRDITYSSIDGFSSHGRFRDGKFIAKGLECKLIILKVTSLVSTAQSIHYSEYRNILLLHRSTRRVEREEQRERGWGAPGEEQRDTVRE